MKPAADRRYSSPQAMNRALTDLLRAHARGRPGVTLDSLRRQFAYDRLLTRIFTSPDGDRWILKGATAILARLAGDARHTRDIDLYRQEEDLPAAENSLRVSVVSYLGLREFARFHVDLVTDLIMTAPPDEVAPLVPIFIAGITSTTYRAYPISDHIADKVCAMIEFHHRSDGQPQPSSRYHDLADLATFARTTVVDAQALIRALRSEANRRNLQLPDRLTIPDPTWSPGYARVARDNPRLVDRDVAQALRTAAALLDPALTMTATGTWDPVRSSWLDR